MKKPIVKGNWILVDNDLKQMHEGDEVKDSRGDSMIVTGGSPPKEKGKSGYISVKHSDGASGWYYPGVCGLEWYLISG